MLTSTDTVNPKPDLRDLPPHLYNGERLGKLMEYGEAVPLLQLDRGRLYDIAETADEATEDAGIESIIWKKMCAKELKVRASLRPAQQGIRCSPWSHRHLLE